MARPVDIRETYEKDVQVIMRVLQAVMKDDTHSQEWRDETALSLRNSVNLLLNPRMTKAVRAPKVAKSA